MSGFFGAASSVIAQSAAAINLTGTTVETTLATIAIPPMAPNDALEIKTVFSFPASANTHIPRVKLGSTYIINDAPASTSVAAHYYQRVQNRNATNSQLLAVPLGRDAQPYGSWASAALTAAEQTNAGSTMLITGQLSVGAETLTLESYQVLIYRG